MTTDTLLEVDLAQFVAAFDGLRLAEALAQTPPVLPEAVLAVINQAVTLWNRNDIDQRSQPFRTMTLGLSRLLDFVDAFLRWADDPGNQLRLEELGDARYNVPLA
jgi:hypothetical protein